MSVINCRDWVSPNLFVYLCLFACLCVCLKQTNEGTSERTARTNNRPNLCHWTLQSLGYIFCRWQCTRVCIYLFIYFQAVGSTMIRYTWPIQSARNHNFSGPNIHSSIIYFGVCGKMWAYYVLHNDFGNRSSLNSKPLQSPFSTTALSFDADIRRTPSEYPHKPVTYSRKNRNFGIIIIIIKDKCKKRIRRRNRTSM